MAYRKTHQVEHLSEEICRECRPVGSTHWDEDTPGVCPDHEWRNAHPFTCPRCPPPTGRDSSTRIVVTAHGARASTGETDVRDCDT